MKRSMIGRLVTLVALVVLASAGMAAAQGARPTAGQTTPDTAHDSAIKATGKPAPTPEELATSKLTVNQQIAVSCSICFTCGGDWPFFSGTLPTARAAVERGSACSGDFGTTLNDFVPFLCCR